MDLRELCDRLRSASSTLEPNDGTLAWPAQQLQWCAEAGVFRWFVPSAYGGWNWSESQQLECYLAISESCLTTAFVLTQWNAACKRIALSENAALRTRLLPALARGEIFATVGISHLTTSRQHLQAPVLAAREDAQGSHTLQGFSPWVTGASAADVLVVGATRADGRQILCALPSNRTGITPAVPARLVALSGSQTGAVRFEDVTVQPDEIIAGPVANVMQSGLGGGAGGLQTSTLAIGLTNAAVKFLQGEAQVRRDLASVTEKLAADAATLRSMLLGLASGEDVPLTPAKLREQANSLVLRATQAALVGAKGAGFVADHPVGRYCREALFFLVWSCPQPVLAANLCEFAQV